MADGLGAIWRGEDCEDAEATLQLLAELALRGLAYLRALERAAKERQ